MNIWKKTGKLLKKYSQENTEMESPLALALKAMMAEDK